MSNNSVGCPKLQPDKKINKEFNRCMAVRQTCQENSFKGTFGGKESGTLPPKKKEV